MAESITEEEYRKIIDNSSECLYLTEFVIDKLIDSLIKLKIEKQEVPEHFYPFPLPDFYEESYLGYECPPPIYATLVLSDKSGIGQTVSLVTKETIEDITDYATW